MTVSICFRKDAVGTLRNIVLTTEASRSGNQDLLSRPSCPKRAGQSRRAVGSVATNPMSGALEEAGTIHLDQSSAFKLYKES